MLIDRLVSIRKSKSTKFRTFYYYIVNLSLVPKISYKLFNLLQLDILYAMQTVSIHRNDKTVNMAKSYWE